MTRPDQLQQRGTQQQRDIFARWLTDDRGIIVKIVRSFTLDPTDADDLTQEIILALWRSIPSFRGQCKQSTWIWRIALNRAISWQRSDRFNQTVIDDLAEVSARGLADDQFLVNRIYAAIHTLKPIDRSLIMLSLEGYRYTEIAEMTGLSVSNVGARLSRARTRLDTHLEDTR